MENECGFDKRTGIIKFRVNKAEAEFIEQKFHSSGYKSKSDFIRMMIIQGIIIHIDEKTIKILIRSFRSVANNFNQIAVRVNSTGSIYREDLNELKKGIDDLRQLLRYFRSVLQNTKPLPTSQTPKKPITDD